MTRSADVIIVGAGAVGSAALYQLARRGVRVLAIDRFAPPHDRGSSHGETRITRLALGEGTYYVQFARRSHEIWRELESATGRTLLRQVGGLIYGPEKGGGVAHGTANFLQATKAVAERYGIAHEMLGSTELRERFPQFNFREDEICYFEREAGFVLPEECIAAELEMARRLGATIRTGEQVMRWGAGSSGARVETDAGSYEAERLILCAGAWIAELAPALASKVKIYRQTLFWFEPDGPIELFSPERMPVYIRMPDAGAAMFYGFPALAGFTGGMKIAGEQFDETCAPDFMEIDVRPEEMAAMHRVAVPHVRLGSRCVKAVACKYTVTPDFDFVIDRHPESDRVWLASPCSGHGFKHSAAVGEALAELAVDGKTKFDLNPFRLARFAP